MFKRLFIAAIAALFLLPSAGAQDTEKINKKNLVVKEWNVDAKSNKKILDHTTTYNAEGRKIEEIEYNSDGQKWRKRYEWGENGKIARELVYDEHNRLVSTKKFEYNEFGRKKTQYTYNAKGKLKTIKQFEYVTEE
ncbi:MAG: hypothetical protein IJ151_01085 [Bacteroidales bacterium]|nr:hypothetical protein [Bacteroidales bacterium]